VVEAMNRMAGKLEQLFTEKVVLTEELRRKALTDPLTGALNRRAFRDRISSALDEERGEAGGSLLMIQIRGLDELNRTRGHKYVDELLLEASRQVDKTLSPWEQAFQGRIEGSIFMVFFPACTLDDNRQVTERMFRELASMHCFNFTSDDNHLHIASVTHRGRCSTEALFDQVEQLMLSLEVQVNNCWEVADVSGEESHAYMRWSDEQWRRTLEDVFTRRQIELHCQPVFDRQGRQLFKEVYARLKLEGEQVSAEAFLPMVERFGLHAEFDRAVFLALADHMEHTDEHQVYCLNLAPHSLMDGRFYHWLFTTLRSRPDVSRRLVLETPERTLVLVGDQMSERVHKLVSTGCRFSVDHFGIASQCLASLQAMDFHYIKVDSSFIRDIDENQGNQLYIRTLAMLAGARDIQIFAQGIEHENEWNTLIKLGIHGGQGYYLGRPGHL
ncbi:MAG: EAL domain-containing protein, partial [Endozoicomonas sp.]